MRQNGENVLVEKKAVVTGSRPFRRCMLASGEAGGSGGDDLAFYEAGALRGAAYVHVGIGSRFSFAASVTTPGLLSAGVLVSIVLLSTAVIVAVATRKSMAD